jgi:hypothetical protein
MPLHSTTTTLHSAQPALPHDYYDMPFLDDHSYLYPRDASTQLTPNATQRTTLIVAGCYVIAIAILW